MDIWIVFHGFVVVVLQLQTILLWTILHMTCLLLQICRNISRESNEEPSHWVPRYEYVHFRWINPKVYPKVVILAFFSPSCGRSTHFFSWTTHRISDFWSVTYRADTKYVILSIIFLITKWAKAHSLCLGSYSCFVFWEMFKFFLIFLFSFFTFSNWIMDTLSSC